MKNLSLFPLAQNLNENSRVLFYAQEEEAVPTYLQSNDLKLDRFKEIVMSYTPGFNKKSLHFVVNYLKELEEKIRIVLVRSPGGPNRHCLLFGKSKDLAEEGANLYFRVGIVPSSEKHPKGRMYVESVESGEKTYFETTDTGAFDRAMKKFYKEAIVDNAEAAEVVVKEPKQIIEPVAEQGTVEPYPRLKKAKEFLGASFENAKKYGGIAINTSQDLLIRAKQQFKKYKKTI